MSCHSFEELDVRQRSCDEVIVGLITGLKSMDRRWTPPKVGASKRYTQRKPESVPDVLNSKFNIVFLIQAIRYDVTVGKCFRRTLRD